VSGLTGTPGNGQVSLSWTDPADADLDHIEITYTPGGPAQPITVAKGTGTRIVTGLTNGTPYTFTVKAVDAAGNQSAGQSAGALTPLAPTGLVTVEFGDLPGDEEITLTGPENTLSWFADTAIIISVNGTFAACRWALDGVATGETGNSVTLYAGNLAVKNHYVTVFVQTTGDGPEYAKRVNFTVTP
jgi:chitodextrinase